MFKEIKLFLVMSFLCACSTSNNKSLQIDFSADSSMIIFKQIEPAGLLQLKNNLPTDTQYQKLVSVLQTPGDDDSTSMEMEWPGKLVMDNDQLVFVPDSPFRKGKLYLVQTMLHADFATTKEVLHAEVGHHVKPQQQLLKR